MSSARFSLVALDCGMITAWTCSVRAEHRTAPNPWDQMMTLILKCRAKTLLVALLAVGASVRGEESPGSSVADTGPWIRANQVGYLTDDPKIAVLSSGAALQ